MRIDMRPGRLIDVQKDSHSAVEAVIIVVFSVVCIEYL